MVGVMKEIDVDGSGDSAQGEAVLLIPARRAGPRARARQ